MKLRALTSSQVTRPLPPGYVHQPLTPRLDNILVYVKGPEYNDNGDKLAEGETVEVPDDYVVNPDVWEVLVPPANGQPVRRPAPRHRQPIAHDNPLAGMPTAG